MATQNITFTEWTPDQPSIVTNLSKAEGVFATQVGYSPFPTAVDYSQAASENLTNVFSARFSATNLIFAGGVTKLFRLDGADYSMDNVSKTGNYAGVVRWNFVQFGDTILAANNINKLQYYTIGSSTTFNDAAAAAPVSKYVTIVRDFVVCGNLNAGDDSSTVQWSDINDFTDWTAGGASQSDSQIIPDGGNITGLSGGEFGLVFLQRAIVRMSYIGSPYFFQFDTITRNLGCLEGNSIAQHGSVTYFLAEDGFYACDGRSVEAIGNEKIDRFFLRNADPSALNTMSATIDPFRKLVIWNYKDVFAKRELLIYNWLTKKWTTCSTDTDYVSSIVSSGFTLEGLDAPYEINAYNMIATKEYTISKLGSNINWTSIGAANAVVGAKLTRNTTSITGSSATYTQSGTTAVTVTLTSHGLITGDSVYLDFTTGTAVDGNYIVTVLTANTFTIVQDVSRTTSGNVTVYSGRVIDLEAARNAGYALDYPAVYPATEGLPSMTTSLDSPLYTGGKFLLAAARGTKIATFTGASSPAQIDTGYIGSQYNSTVTLARPIIDNGSADVAILSVNLLSEVKDFSTYTSSNSENRVPLRSNGKYHKLSIKPTGDRWSNALGVDIDVTPQGTR